MKLHEVVDFSQASNVETGLTKKYGAQAFGPGTFGIEIEFNTSEDTLEGEQRDLIITHVDGDTLGTIIRRESPRRAPDDYAEWLKANRERVNRFSHHNGWDDSYGPPNDDEWVNEHPEPDEAGDEHEEWEQGQRAAMQNYNQWERRNWDDYYPEFVESIGYDIFEYAAPQDIISTLGRNPRYASLYTRLADDRMKASSAAITYVVEYLESVLHQKVGKVPTETDWNVDMDGENVEVRTRHLTTKDFEVVKRLFVWLRDQGYDMNHDTSAHVHVGLPENFDTFSVLALSTLVDERAIKTAVGKRSLNTWARLRDSFEMRVSGKIAEMLNESRVEYVPFTEDRLHEFVWKVADKNTGTNLRSYFQHHTVEFRYFGSNVSDLDNFLSWVRYFMLLPAVAAKRKEIKIGKVYFTRPENDDGIVVASLKRGVRMSHDDRKKYLDRLKLMKHNQSHGV